MATIAASAQWAALKDHAAEVGQQHLRDLLKDDKRAQAFIKEFGGITLDFTRHNATEKTLELLLALAEEAKLKTKIEAMFSGEHINATEDRAVLHVATRARPDQAFTDGGKNYTPEVWEVLNKVKGFSDKIRSGEWKGVTGKALTSVVAIGIGGSYLGPLFVHTALTTEPTAAKAAAGRELRFLANVDPIDVSTALHGLNAEETLVVIISKTFTTAETMLNARTVRSWLVSRLGAESIPKHMVAVSTNLKLVEEFGIDPENAFGFWDFIGGRFSVTSAVGVVPLSLQYGFEVVEQFLKGANSVDDHFRTAPLKENLPVLLGLLSVWNVSFLNLPARAILPYCNSLAKFAPHIQQVSMESNGKGVDMNGNPLPFQAGEIDFGEPGTNGQHSFYQLIHQGRTIPADFIGIIKSQQPIALKGEAVSNHEELMCNFFAQPDALAYGKTAEELKAANTPEALIPHKTFSGNRPSLSLLLPELTAYTVGQLLALYEHRVAVQGFIWGINSFDQWGVELGKVLATKVRKTIAGARAEGRAVGSADGYNYGTALLLNKFLKHGQAIPAEADSFPAQLQ